MAHLEQIWALEHWVEVFIVLFLLVKLFPFPPSIMSPSLQHQNQVTPPNV